MDLRYLLDDVRYAVTDHPRRTVLVALVAALLVACVILVPSLLSGSDAAESSLADGPPVVSQAEGECVDELEAVTAFTREHTFAEVQKDEVLSKEYTAHLDSHRAVCPIREGDVLQNTVVGPWMLVSPLEPVPAPTP